MNEVKQLERVRLDEIGMYLKAIAFEYGDIDNRQMSILITRNFKVLCTEQDVDNYEVLEQYHNARIEEDYELEARRDKYFRSLNTPNPY